MNYAVEPPHDTEISCVVEAITRRRLVVPAIFLLEMGKPLVGCMRELSLSFEPLIRMVVGELSFPGRIFVGLRMGGCSVGPEKFHAPAR